jgi:hypothetical protein
MTVAAGVHGEVALDREVDLAGGGDAVVAGRGS